MASDVRPGAASASARDAISSGFTDQVVVGRAPPSTLESTFGPNKRNQMAPGDATVGTGRLGPEIVSAEPRLYKRGRPRGSVPWIKWEYSLLFPWLNYLEVGATRLIGYWGATEQKSSIRRAVF